MKIGTLKRSSETDDRQEIHVSGGTLFKGVTITALLTTLITVFTFYFINLPTNNQKMEFQADLEQFQYLNFALRQENDTIRSATVQLLLELNIIEDESGSLPPWIKDYKLPDWSDYPEFPKLNK